MLMNSFEIIYEIVRKIPYGKVATYGQIARLARNPRMSRVVGYAMHSAPDDVPCHRVVNRFGELTDAFRPFGKATHRMLLEMEGIEFKADGCVDLGKYQWNGVEDN